MKQRYTRAEVARMIGVSRRRLDYWTRLGLVDPEIRWSERFYNFADLVALETIKQLTAHRVPARRLGRAISALKGMLGQEAARLSKLSVFANARQVVVTPSSPRSQPFEPLTGQFVMHFDTEKLAGKVRIMAGRTAEDWFEEGLASDSNPATLPKAAQAYRRATELAPDWPEAHINLGATLYRLRRIPEARSVFAAAVALAPNNHLAHFNLGCTLDALGDTQAAVERLARAVELAPHFADAHLNLALAYDKLGEKRLTRKHLSLYLHYQPQGQWAELARSRMRASGTARPTGKLTTFPGGR